MIILIKRRQIAKLILAKQADIICIQETHLRTSEEHYLGEVYKGTLYQAAASTKTKGVLLGISARLPWICNTVIADPYSKYVILNWQLEQRSGYHWCLLHKLQTKGLLGPCS